MRLPVRRWSIGWVLEPAVAPAAMRAEAERWRDRPFRGSARPCWTFRGAQRLARRWNHGHQCPGLWEVFGPLGKGDD